MAAGIVPEFFITIYHHQLINTTSNLLTKLNFFLSVNCMTVKKTFRASLRA